MPNPLVSVIVPAYNCSAYIVEAIESVLNQDYSPLEVIVVDDGSTDDTLKVLEQFRGRIQIHCQPNRGPAAARNLAVRHASGDYLAFLDGDDLWAPGHTSALMAFVTEHADTKVAYGEWIEWMLEPSGTFPPLTYPLAPMPVQIDDHNSGWVYSKLLFDAILHIIATVIHRSVFDAVGGFDESLRTGSDYDFWLRVSRKYPVVKLRRLVAVYRQNPVSVTNTVRRENNGYRVLRRALDTYGLGDEQGHSADARAVARRLSGLAFAHGYRHFWRGDSKLAAEWFLQSWRDDRTRLKAIAYCGAAIAKSWGLYNPQRKGTPGLPPEA